MLFRERLMQALLIAGRLDNQNVSSSSYEPSVKKRTARRQEKLGKLFC